MMKLQRGRILSLVILVLTLGASQFALAQTGAAPQALRDKLVQSIEVSSQNQLQIISLRPTPLQDIYLVELNTGEILYSDISGDYLFAGDMYETTPGGLLNLSSSVRQERTLEKITAIDTSEMIVFSPEGEVRASLTVFTDVDCTFCRRLHSDLNDILANGIEIRYLAYPRGGENAESYDKMISVWCSDDRHKSLTQAKNGQNLPGRDCQTPILKHYALGNELGIQGTPAVVAPDGRIMPGYGGLDYLLAFLELE